MTEKERYEQCLKNKIPYFGSHMFASQGNPRRHIYMQELVKMVSHVSNGQHIKILEVGSWAGGSAISWAEAITKYNSSNGSVVCIDPWMPYFDPATVNTEIDNPVYDAMNKHAESGEIFNLFNHNISTAGYSGIIHPFRGSSDIILPLLNRDTFDIIFIDGDHRYSPATRDIINCVTLVKNGGYLCGDDLELQINEIDVNHAIINSYKDYLLDPIGNTYFHPGVTLAVGRQIGPVSVYEGFWVVNKNSNRWDRVEMTGQNQSVPDHLQAP